MDRATIKERAEAAAEATRRFNRKPPQWFYWVLGIAIVLAFQLLRHI